jgi:putative serine protease PepD
VYGSVPPHTAAPISASPVPQPPLYAPPRRSLGWPGIVALALAGVLVVLVGLQAYQIQRLGSDLTRTRADLARLRADTNERLTAADDWTAAQFDSERLAGIALESVFRVRAGDYFGSAFAVGEPASDGGTNLFTNFHVVEQVWDRGERKVKLEHADQLFEATIVAGDKKLDVAQLHTTAKIDGLAVAEEAAKPGQPVLVAGAPQGLKDTVTTGIVSSFRDATSDHGPYIQFDAPINPGNSGGPVINARAEVIGIASAKFLESEGIGLAIPIGLACDKYPVC